jgi:hypothetical protein
LLEHYIKTKPKEINLNQVKKKLTKKYPKVISMVEVVMESSRDYTENVKGKYPQYNTLKEYASSAGFSEILIGVVIQYKKIVQTMRAWFDPAWIGARDYCLPAE